MNFLRHNWYYIGAVIGACTLVYVLFAWKNLTILQRLLLLNFVTMTFHQLSEFGFPGGMPYASNVINAHSDVPDRYPMNPDAAMVGNMATVYLFFLLPVFFPKLLWFGMGGIFVGLSQIPVHIKATQLISKAVGQLVYGPGNISVFLGHLPISIFYFYYGTVNNWFTAWDFLWAFLVMIFVDVGLVAVLGYKMMGGKNVKHGFTEKELARSHFKEKYEPRQKLNK